MRGASPRGRVPRWSAVLLCTFAAGCAGVGASGAALRTASLGDQTFVATAFGELDDIRAIALSDARICAATDRGLVVYLRDSDGAPERVTTAEGLPSNDVRAVFAEASGSVLVATDAGVARWRKQVVAVFPAPPVGRVNALALDASGSLWSCGEQGLAKQIDQAWALFGDRVHCQSLVLAPSGTLWAGTATGALHIEGNVIGEHRIAAGNAGVTPTAVSVRRVVALGDSSSVLALVEQDGAAALALYDGYDWSAHTIPGESSAVVDLVAGPGGAVLVTTSGAWSVSARPRGEAKPLRELWRNARARTLSYRGDFWNAEASPGAVLAADAFRGDVRAGQRRSSPALSPAGAADEEHAALFARRLPVEIRGGAAAVADGTVLAFAERGRGIATASLVATAGAAAPPRRYLAKSLVRTANLELATDAQGRVLLRSADGRVARVTGEEVSAVPLPGGRAASAIAEGPGGVYAVALTESQSEPPTVAAAAPSATPTPSATPAPPEPTATTTAAVFRWDADEWVPVLERDVTAHAVSAITALFVDSAGDAWLALRSRTAAAPASAGPDRARGVLWLGAAGAGVVPFHARIEPVPGAAAKPAPDDLSRPVAGESGFVWWSSVLGAVRSGGEQVVVFGEDRGVPGEVVTDMAFAPPNRVWIAAAEGLGYYQGSSMHFDETPKWVRDDKPTSLARGADGTLWAAGAKGVLAFDGTNWQRVLGIGGPVRDLAVDGSGALWVLTESELLRLTKK